MQGKFLIRNVGDETTGPTFGELGGTIDIIYAATFVHLFKWEERVGPMQRVVRLLKPVLGSFIVGRQRGNVIDQKGNISRHNEESWKEIWQLWM